MTNEDKAKRIIKKIVYITLATCSKSGQPWNSPLYSVHDKAYNFYWASPKEAVHSQNIRENDNVFLVIYDSTAPEGTGEGVYIKAKACEINNTEDVEEVLKVYSSTVGANMNAKEFQGDYPRRFYKAVPEKVWINGEGEVNGNYIDIRTEVNLLK